MHSELYGLLGNETVTFGAAQSPALSVIGPNKSIPQGLSETHLRVSLLPLEQNQIIVSGPGAIAQWLWQISVYNLPNKGAYNALVLVDAITAMYPLNRKLVGAQHEYKVVRPADAIPPVESDGWYFTPVQTRLQTIT